MAKKLTKKEVQAKINTKYNKEYTLLSEYKSMNDEAELLHKPCGNKIYTKRLKDFINEGKNQCRVCKPVTQKYKGGTRVTEEVFAKRIKERKDGKEYEYVGGFKNTKTKCKIKHLKCGNIFETTPDTFLNKLSTCPSCSGSNRGKYALKDNYLEGLLKEAKYGQEYEWLEEYKGNNKLPHKIRHIKCGHEYEVKPNCFQQGNKCPKCYLMFKSESEASKYITEFLEDKNVKFDKEITLKGLRYRRNLRCDFLLTEYSTIIEYDGVQHFKVSGSLMEEHIKLTKERDKAKNEFFKNKPEYNFIRIPYTTDENDLDMILDGILNNKGKVPTEIINEYSLLVCQDNKIYNEEEYYNSVNKNYHIAK